jgi:hypothetical protein
VPLSIQRNSQLISVRASFGSTRTSWRFKRKKIEKIIVRIQRVGGDRMRVNKPVAGEINVLLLLL